MHESKWRDLPIFDLAIAAAREIIRFGFERMHLNRIDADTIEDNHESVRMLKKLGFVREGIRRGYSHEDDGEYHASTINGLPRSDYYARKQ